MAAALTTGREACKGVVLSVLFCQSLSKEISRKPCLLIEHCLQALQLISQTQGLKACMHLGFVLLMTGHQELAGQALSHAKVGIFKGIPATPILRHHPAGRGSAPAPLCLLLVTPS